MGMKNFYTQEEMFDIYKPKMTDIYTNGKARVQAYRYGGMYPVRFLSCYGDKRIARRDDRLCIPADIYTKTPSAIFVVKFTAFDNFVYEGIPAEVRTLNDYYYNSPYNDCGLEKKGRQRRR